MSKNLVIVESPAKAKTIEKYLGSDFQVLASIGHIRKDTKVDKKTFDVTYEIDPDHKKIISELKKAAKSADKVWLATDEDREGEAISWHLCEVLDLPKDTARITFHEITKPALDEAIKNPRQVDMDMVSSQQARQTLDMLVGYDLSGIVRKKVPGAISAGRVQSPALRLVVEKEQEIEKFEANSSYKTTGVFVKSDEEFNATLDKNFDTESDAKAFLEQIKDSSFAVSAVETTPGERKPSTPFTTAAMQIEANSKLGFSARTTMSAAQGLYQAGLITYHRTDSLNLSNQALTHIASYIESEFGKEYLKVRKFKTKDASAQEAHEAIRPTDISRETAGKNDYEKRLYDLIRSRTLASQMAPAKVSKTTIAIKAFDTAVDGRAERGSASISATRPWRRAESTRSGDGDDVSFIAKGEIITFDGFLRVYGKLNENNLPALQEGDQLKVKQINSRQTFAKAPARYTEGSLVKKLEELGIGRPSTYASIMSAIQARGYVIKGESDGEEREVSELVLKGGKVTAQTVIEKSGANKGKLLPAPIGELLSGFLVDNFKNIVDYKFTANIEKDLDLIADAKLEKVKMLKDFYKWFSQEVDASEDVDRYNNARTLGQDPKTGKTIYAKIGKNGGFIQLGENEKESGEKPRFAPLPDRKTVKTVTLEQALEQLELPALPRSLGKTKDGIELIAASGPFGPYLKADKYNISLGKEFDPYTITLEEAEPLYIKKRDSYIADWGDIQIIEGAYGPYVKGPGRRNNVRIPKDQDPKKITKEQALEMLEKKPKTKRKSTKIKKKDKK